MHSIGVMYLIPSNNRDVPDNCRMYLMPSICRDVRDIPPGKSIFTTWYCLVQHNIENSDKYHYTLAYLLPGIV